MGNSAGSGLVLEEGFGYRVIQILPDSPAHEAGLRLFLDFIIDIDDRREKTKGSTHNLNFFDIVKEFEGREVVLTVYGIRERRTRKLVTVPSKDWSNADSLLGVMLRYENYVIAHELTFRVLDVLENSPAQRAGLVSQDDYVLGLVKYKIKDVNELIDYIAASQYYEDKGLEIVVYNIKTNETRKIFLEPKFKWGGQGCLGCYFGSGLLNNLPMWQVAAGGASEYDSADKLTIELIQHSAVSATGIIDYLYRKRKGKVYAPAGAGSSVSAEESAYNSHYHYLVITDPFQLNSNYNSAYIEADSLQPPPSSTNNKKYADNSSDDSAHDIYYNLSSEDRAILKYAYSEIEDINYQQQPADGEEEIEAKKHDYYVVQQSYPDYEGKNGTKEDVALYIFCYKLNALYTIRYNQLFDLKINISHTSKLSAF